MPSPRLQCGGCQHGGSHKRWCRVEVGDRAALLGPASERLEHEADQIGSNHPETANALYRLAGNLQCEAKEARRQWRARRT